MRPIPIFGFPLLTFGQSNIAFSPVSISGLLGWFDAGIGVYSDVTFTTPAVNAGTVAGWEDLSGNGNHLTQSTVGLTPFYLVSSANGKPAVDFDSAFPTLIESSALDNFISGNDLPVSIMVVYKPDSVAIAAEAMGGWGSSSDANPYFVWRGSGATPRFSKRDDAAALVEVNANAQAAAGTYRMMSYIHNGTSSSLYLNSDAGVTTAQNVGQITLNRFALGCRPSTTNLQPFNGSIAECLLYNRALNNTERLQIETYLRVKYALP